VRSTVGQGSAFRLEMPANAEPRTLRLVDQEIERDTADDRQMTAEPKEAESPAQPRAASTSSRRA
jgi:hypothetical protein